MAADAENSATEPMADHGASATEGQGDGHGDTQADGQADTQADGQANAQADAAQADAQGDGDAQGDAQSDAQGSDAALVLPTATGFVTSAIPEGCTRGEVKLGIDEAGRGAVLGPGVQRQMRLFEDQNEGPAVGRVFVPGGADDVQPRRAAERTHRALEGF